MEIDVLLADDHKLLRQGLINLLQQEKDIRVVGEAENGIQAIKQTKKLQPDVVLLDIVMPQMNGISIIDKIKSGESEVEIVILSVKDDLYHAHQALQSGAIGYLTKGSAAEKVVYAVRLAYDGKRFISQEINEKLIDKFIVGNGHNSESPLEILSPRERDILQLVAEGRTSKEIAGILHISINTVKTYRKSIMDKLNLESLQDLVKFAIRHEIISI